MEKLLFCPLWLCCLVNLCLWDIFAAPDRISSTIKVSINSPDSTVVSLNQELKENKQYGWFRRNKKKVLWPKYMYLQKKYVSLMFVFYWLSVWNMFTIRLDNSSLAPGWSARSPTGTKLKSWVRRTHFFCRSYGSNLSWWILCKKVVTFSKNFDHLLHWL